MCFWFWGNILDEFGESHPYIYFKMYENWFITLMVSENWVWNFRMRFFVFVILKICHAQKPCTLSPMRINESFAEKNRKTVAY